MITKKTTNRTALGRMTVYMKKGDKTTESVDCSFYESTRTYLQINQINGFESEIVRVLFNGKQIFPEITSLNMKELSAYLPEHPAISTIKTWISKKAIPFHKAGKAKNAPVYFLISEIDKWIADGRTI